MLTLLVREASQLSAGLSLKEESVLLLDLRSNRVIKKISGYVLLLDLRSNRVIKKISVLSYCWT